MTDQPNRAEALSRQLRGEGEAHLRGDVRDRRTIGCIMVDAAELIDELRRSTPEAAPVQGWQLIETAPKNGTPVRVRGPDRHHGNYTGPARWNGHRWEKLHRSGFINMIAYPTHWMPLPPAPHDGGPDA